jgi:hypothetical protein
MFRRGRAGISRFRAFPRREMISLDGGVYLAIADCFLVATGISLSFTELDPARVRSLVERVRAFIG